MDLAISELFRIIGGKYDGFYSVEENDKSKPPQIAWPLGTKIDDVTVAEISGAKSEMNPYRADDLLSSCLTRLANCISLREKAHEIQARALVEGIELLHGEAVEDSQSIIDGILYPGPPIGNGGQDPGKILAEQREVLLQAKKATFKARKAISALTGSGANYAERFSFLKSMFKISFLEAVARGRRAAEAIERIYDIKLPESPSLDADLFLNSFALWVQQIADQLDFEKDRRYKTSLIIPISQEGDGDNVALLSKEEYKKQYDAKLLDFEITEAYFLERDIHKPILRNLGVRATLSNAAYSGRAFPAWITPPQPSLVNSDRTFYHTALVGGPELASERFVTDEVHNLDPIGKWQIRIINADVTGLQIVDADPPNFYLHMTVFGRR